MAEITAYKLSNDKKKKILRQIEEFFHEKPEIEFAYIYGSFNADGPFRDIDIGIYVNENQVKEQVKFELTLEMELERYVGISIPVDIRIVNKGNITYAYNVLKGRLIYNKNDSKRVNFVTYVLSRYFDLKPVLSYYQKEAFVP